MAELLRGQSCVRSPQRKRKRRTKRAEKVEEPKACYSTDEETLKTRTNTTATELKLQEKEAYELVTNNRHFLADSNIVALSVGLKEKDGKETDRLALIFDVVKKLERGKIYEEKGIIPDKVPVKRMESGKWEEIETDVVETGKLIFHRAEGGSAICAEDTPGNALLGPCTLGAILPNIVYGNDTEKPISGKKQMQLITSAHLINYDKQHITKQLRYLERERYVTLNQEQLADEEFLHPNQALFPVTGFYPVKKIRNGDTEDVNDPTIYNQFDILWANVTDPEKVSETFEGEALSGIGIPKDGESFTLTGITSGTHWNGKVSSTICRVSVPGEDSEGEFRTYWENMIRHNLPTRPGDSGAALISSTGKIIGLHTFGCEIGNRSYACQLPSTAEQF